MKTLSATELAVLRRFVRDTLEIIENDVEGITLDLEDGALASAQILDIIIPTEYNEATD